ncbi:MAG: ATP-binding protein [Algicola sp.]|nr:ATP-binding protein [Algicola sp.]
MQYSQIQFGKDLYDLDYNDLVQFFNTEKEETLNLEFKSYPIQGNPADKENAVFKAICGLLNSEGGIVIWGAPVETKDALGNTSAVGALTPFATTLDRDRLINKMSSLIIPLALGIRVQKLNAPNGDSIFVIEVEKSSQKPHQFKNNYYIRLDGQTKIAPHYLIEAMMKSSDFPLIRGHVRLKKIETDGNNYILYFRKVIYNSSKYINDLNLTYGLISGPGTMIINNNQYNGFYNNSIEIISHGKPISGDFRLVIPLNLLIQHNNEVQIGLHFVGQKSPSRMSTYKYTISNPTLGDVSDENILIIEKNENKLSSDISNDSDDDKINSILDL